MTLVDYLKYNGLVFGEDYYVDSDTDNVTSLSDKADELISEFNLHDDIEMIDDEVVDESKVKDRPSQMLIEYAIGTGYTPEYAQYFFKKHPEFIGCETDSEKLHELGEALEKEKYYAHDAMCTENSVEKFVKYPDIVSKNSDYSGLSEEEVNELDSRGAAVKIVNKWLCQALDKNDGEMVRKACIVLKAIERKATFWKGDNFITLNFNVIEKNDNPVYDPENLDDEDPLFYNKLNDVIESKFSEIIQSDSESADYLTGGNAEGLLLSYDLPKDTPKERVEEIKNGILNELRSNPKFKVVKYY